MILSTRHFCRETTSNSPQAQDQSLGSCTLEGVYLNELWLERLAVNPLSLTAGPQPCKEFSVSYAPVLVYQFLGVIRVFRICLQLQSVNHQFIECLGNSLTGSISDRGLLTERHHMTICLIDH